MFKLSQNKKLAGLTNDLSDSNLTIAEITLDLLTFINGALAFDFSFGSKQVIKNASNVALNLQDNVYEVGDIIRFSDDDNFYRIAAIKTSTVKLFSLTANEGFVLNISPSVLAQKEFINYTQDRNETQCKWVFPYFS